MASGLINGNSLAVTSLGIFDYTKNFFVIFIYAVFFRDFGEFNKLFRLLLAVAIFLGIVALIDFCWAMGSVYILQKPITDAGIYVFTITESKDLNNVFWRLGIFRTSSLTNYPYILGLFNLLILVIYVYMEKRVKVMIWGPILIGVLLSMSRIVYGGLIFFVFAQIIRCNKWLILLVLITFSLALSQITVRNDFKISSIVNWYLPQSEINIDKHDIRMYTRYKSTEIWKDHPVWGVGPGMFGGIVASKYKSYVFEEYNVSQKAYIHKVGGIEQFWFQILSEVGIVGALFFMSFIFLLFITLNTARLNSKTHEMRGLFSGLIVFLFCILVYSIGSGINIAAALFTFCAFVGIGMGINNSENKPHSSIDNLTPHKFTRQL